MRLALLALLLACSPRAESREPESRPTPWCVAALLADGTVARGCRETAAQCEHLAEQGRRSGALVGVRAVGSCRRSE